MAGTPSPSFVYLLIERTEMTGKIDRLLDGIIKFFGVIAGILFMMMALIVTYNVVMRYFVARPPVWAVETTEYIMVYATFLAAAWVLSVDGHVKIDILVMRLSPGRRHILNIVVSFLGFVACAILGWFAVKSTYNLYTREVIMMKMMPWPKWILIAPIPLGILLTLIQFIRNLVALLGRKEFAD
jgi:TRAP-type C4-dicarboxylate transport system permease small subunit